MTNECDIKLLDITNQPPERGVAQLLDYAVELHASDLFFLPNEQHVAVRIRHMGLIRPIAVLTSDQGRRYISHIRSLAGMDAGDRRHPADGRLLYQTSEDLSVDARISIIPTLYGEDLAMRLLVRETNLRQLDSLGFTPEQYEAYLQMLASPGGLILIAGPTGTGKTVTLYASLIHLNDGHRKIHTIEDPIEYAVEGLRQSQINPLIDLHFAELLRSVLRQSPDVIMIGEVRDPETARIAVRAANSGVMVLATVHATSAIAALQSMRGYGIHPQFLASSLRGAVSQRLVRTLCPQCRVSFDVSHAPCTFEEVKPWLKEDEGKSLYAAGGCDHCHRTGYAQRTGIFEVLTVTPALRELIAQSQPIRRLREQAHRDEVLTVRQAALLKVARGETSIQEILRVLPTEDLEEDHHPSNEPLPQRL